MSEETTDAELERYDELLEIAFDAARHGKTDTLDSMIEAGLSVDQRDEKGNSFLMLASYNGRPETALMLLKQGADVDLKNNHQQTPLGGVAFKGYPAIAKLLIEHGAEVEAGQGGEQTPLLFAMMFGRKEVAQVLIEAGADPKRKVKWGLTVSQAAKLAFPMRGVATLIDRKAET